MRQPGPTPPRIDPPPPPDAGDGLALAAFNQNFETFRALNALMWQVPLIAMTLTGGLWFGVASISRDSGLVFLRPGLLLLAGVGDLLLKLIQDGRDVQDLTVKLEDGRTAQVSVNCSAGTGALVTLHDIAAEEELEHEVQVARRLASIGRLMAGVGHEVKNPINAMVVHLELLRGKLAQPPNLPGAQRHAIHA